MSAFEVKVMIKSDLHDTYKATKNHLQLHEAYSGVTAQQYIKNPEKPKFLTSELIFQDVIAEDNDFRIL